MSNNYFNNQCSNGFQSSRKRIPNFNSEESYDSKINLPLPELDFNDPDFLKLLKEYEKEEDDYPSNSAEREKELRVLKSRSRDRPLLDHGSTYVCLFLAFVLFIFLINWCNTKELQRLKQEFGHEAKKAVPEFWWKKAFVYRLHVPSFSDSDGDGIGDLMGVLNNVDYLTYLGVDAVVLRSIMEYSVDEGHIGVSNFTNIDPRIGNFRVLQVLVKEFHNRGTKVIIEVIPNHTSRKHVWFQTSRLAKQEIKFKGRAPEEVERFLDYYVWNEGLDGVGGSKVPPNNWLGTDDNSAWTCEGTTGCYYHHFHATLPDLNHRNFEVQREMLATFKFWLDRGFDAIYLDNVSPLFESTDVTSDEPVSPRLQRMVKQDEKRKMSMHEGCSHVFTLHQPELHDYLGSWNEFVQSYSLKRNQRLSLLIDVPIEDSGPETGAIAKNFLSWADTPIMRSLMNINELCRGMCLQETIEASTGKLPPGRDPMWMVGPKEGSQSMPPIFHNVYNALLLLLPGGVLMKTGSEMGDFEELQNLRGYKSSSHNYMFDRLVKNLTFSSSTEFVFMPPSSQQTSASSSSASLKVVHSLTRIRKEPSFLIGQLQYGVVNENILSFVRFLRDEPPYLVTLNLGQSPSTEDYSLSTAAANGKVVVYIPPHRRAVIGGKSDATSEEKPTNEELAEDKIIDLSKVALRPGEGVVVKLLLGNQREDLAANQDEPMNINENDNIDDDDDDDDVMFDAVDE